MAKLRGYIVGEKEATKLLASSRITRENPQYERLHRIAAASYSFRATEAPAWMVHSLIEQVLPELGNEFERMWRQWRALEARRSEDRQTRESLRQKYEPQFRRDIPKYRRLEAARRARRRMDRDGVGESPRVETIRKW